MTESTSLSLPVRRWLRRLAYTSRRRALLAFVAWLAVPPIVRAQLESRLTAGARPADDRGVRRLRSARACASRSASWRRRPRGAQRCSPIDELVANLSWASLWHRAPVLDALSIVRPRLSPCARSRRPLQHPGPDRQGAGRPSDPPRFSLNNIEVDDGRSTSPTASPAASTSSPALDIGIPFLSTLPYQTDIHVTPRMGGHRRRALRAGRTDHAVRRAPRSHARHRPRRAGAAAYVAYLPSQPRVDLAGGALTTQLKVVFVETAAGERRLELRGDAQGRRARVQARATGRSLAARRARGRARAHRRLRPRCADRSGRDRRAGRRRDAAGRRHARMGRSAASTPRLPLRQRRRAPRARPPGRPSASLRSRAARSRSRTRRRLPVHAGRHRARRDQPQHEAGRKGARQARLRVGGSDRRVSGRGRRRTHGAGAAGRFALSKFSLGLLFPYYKSALAVDVQKGSLDYASAFALDAAGNLRLRKARPRSPISASPCRATAIRLARASAGAAPTSPSTSRRAR